MPKICATSLSLPRAQQLLTASNQRHLKEARTELPVLTAIPSPNGRRPNHSERSTLTARTKTSKFALKVPLNVKLPVTRSPFCRPAAERPHRHNHTSSTSPAAEAVRTRPHMKPLCGCTMAESSVFRTGP